MIFRVPIFYSGEKTKGVAQLYTGRPLFFPFLRFQNENLNRLTGKLARKLSEHLNNLAKEARHDALADWSFNPAVAQHRVDLEIELRRKRAKARFFFVVFKHLQRRVAFTPTLPELWFELNRNESLKDRATAVLTDHFRKLERGDNEVDVESHGISGTAWVAALELSVRPPKEVPKAKVNRFQFLGASEPADGNYELRRVGRCLDWLYPDELDRALLRDPEVEELSRLLTLDDRRPVLLLGAPQVGKSAVIQECVFRRVSKRPSPYRDRNNLWLLSPQRLISGMSYVGQWEDRLLAILKETRKRDHVLYFDDLLGLFLAGISASSTLSVAAVLRPYLERRELRALGEITPEGFRVSQERDRSFADLFHVLPIRESTEVESLRILLGVQRQLEPKHRCNFDLDVLPTVIDLQRRYARQTAFPGKAARMMRQLAVKAEKEASPAGTTRRRHPRRSGRGSPATRY